jgi:NagD protein
VFSRGAMLTAALAKATGARPRIVGKPSRASVREVSERLGVAPESLVVVGDDAALDVALGRLAGAHTILVRSGISGSEDLGRLPPSRRPHEVVDGVADLLPRL